MSKKKGKKQRKPLNPPGALSDLQKKIAEAAKRKAAEDAKPKPTPPASKPRPVPKAEAPSKAPRPVGRKWKKLSPGEQADLIVTHSSRRYEWDGVRWMCEQGFTREYGDIRRRYERGEIDLPSDDERRGMRPKNVTTYPQLEGPELKKRYENTASHIVAKKLIATDPFFKGHDPYELAAKINRGHHADVVQRMRKSWGSGELTKEAGHETKPRPGDEFEGIHPHSFAVRLKACDPQFKDYDIFRLGGEIATGKHSDAVRSICERWAKGELGTAPERVQRLWKRWSKP